MINAKQKTNGEHRETPWTIPAYDIPQINRSLHLGLSHQHQEGLALICAATARHLPLPTSNHTSWLHRREPDGQAKHVMRFACVYSREGRLFVYSKEHVKSIVEAILGIPDDLESALVAIAATSRLGRKMGGGLHLSGEASRLMSLS